MPAKMLRTLSLEPLEVRTVLSANPMAAGGADAVHAQDPVIIDAIHLQVGDRQVTVTERNAIVVYESGESIDVIGIDYEVTGEGVDMEGLVAFEGYLREPTDDNHHSHHADHHTGHENHDHALGEFDYEDGRFGDPMGEEPLAEGMHNHSGLEGEWDLVDGTNRMSIALVRYFGDQQWEAHDRFFVNLQQGKADVVLSSIVYKWYGKDLKLGATVTNLASTTVSTYTEIDIYHEDDLVNPVWVGIFETTLSPGKTEFQRFYNPESDDSFEKYWRPEESGTYVVKVYLDPEDAIREVDESNNFVEGKIQVEAKEK